MPAAGSRRNGCLKHTNKETSFRYWLESKANSPFTQFSDSKMKIIHHSKCPAQLTPDVDQKC